MKAVRTLAVGLLAAGTVLGVGVYAQQPTPQPKQPGFGGGVLPGEVVPVNPFQAGQPYFRGFNPFQQQAQAAQLARKYVKEKDEDKRRDVHKQLTDLLNKEFEDQLKHQKEEVKALEKQLNELKALIERRSDAKQTIVEDRIKTLVNEAKGLGWNAPSGPRGVLFGRPGSPYPPVVPVTDDLLHKKKAAP
jgi:hypothetical protein